jgi:hypothetical protein
MFWVMMGVIVMILCTGLITLRAAIRSNRVKYGKTYYKTFEYRKIYGICVYHLQAMCIRFPLVASCTRLKLFLLKVWLTS